MISVDETGQELTGDVVIRDTVEEAVLADSVGVDSFNIAEHDRQDVMDPAGAVILAAIAGRTRHIRLGTAVTVLSTRTRSGSTTSSPPWTRSPAAGPS
jgi:alkanesulfonate monooxygenase SsuD/methylene tetrahydromethanopterin reductase-like flavin-dependent oxidoreductase (luciferase family)